VLYSYALTPVATFLLGHTNGPRLVRKGQAKKAALDLESRLPVACLRFA